MQRGREGLLRLTEVLLVIHRSARFAFITLCIALAGCTAQNSDPAPVCGAPKLSRPLLVLEGDETTSAGLGRLGPDGCLKEVADANLGNDVSLSDVAGRPFACNRSDSVCREINRATLADFGALTTWQSDADTRSNPHDLDIDTKGQFWIARYDLASLAILRPDGTFAGSVDLSPLADSDGNPEMEAIRILEDRGYVALELLHLDKSGNYIPTGPGKIAVVDLTKRMIVGSFLLHGENPFGKMRPVLSDPSGGTVAIATPGSFFDANCATCGAELVDLAKGTSTLVLRETDLGGSVSETLIASPTEGYAIVMGPDTDNPTWVVEFDPSTQKVTRTLADTRPLGMGARGYYYWGLAIDGDYVLVGDRTKLKPGIRFFRRSDGVEAPMLGVQIFPPIALMPL